MTGTELMNGLTLIEIRDGSNWVLCMVATMILIGICCGLIEELKECWDKNEYIRVCFRIVLIAMTLMCVCLDIKDTYNAPDKMRVKLDNTVTVNEFVERYDILDIDGDIFTITEKRE